MSDRHDLLRSVPAVGVVDNPAGPVRFDPVPVALSLQRGAVVLDRFVHGIEGEGGHFDWVRVKYGRVELTITLYSLAYR